MRKFLLLISMIFAVNAISAQKYFGIKAGYTTSTYSIADATTKQLFEPQCDIGFIYKYFNNQYVGLQLELNLNQRGYRKVLNKDENHFEKVTNKYLELPVLTQFRFGTDNFYVHFAVGTYISYLLEMQSGDNISGNYTKQDIRLNILKHNRFDFGIAGGLGFSYDFKKSSIQLEGRYNFGLANLYKPNYEENPNSSAARFININLSYSYVFGEKPEQN